ncbi:MAG: hypothetical protein ABIO31_09730 [Candidatus Nitrotoga sp.]
MVDRITAEPTYFLELSLKCDRGLISQTCLYALPSTKYFYVFWDGLNGLGAGIEAPLMHQSIFVQSPKAFSWGRCRISFSGATLMTARLTDRANF